MKFRSPVMLFIPFIATAGILVPPLFTEEKQDLNRIEDSVNRLNKKVESLEKSMDELRKSREESDSNFYADQNQTKLPVSPDFSNGPFAVRNNFDVISFVSMSNKKGERAAFVTLKNGGPKTRIAKEYIIATFADNSRAIAKSISLSEIVNEGGFVSLTAYFGESDFPVVHVGTR